MRIVQSFWSKPITVADENDLHARGAGGWLSNRYHWMSWALSCLKFRQFYDEVELVTDPVGREILVGELNLPFTKVTSELENIDSYHPKLWSLGKIYTYSIQRSPFIHADGDFIIFKRLPKRIERSPLMAQSPERNENYYEKALEQVYAHFKYIPEEFERTSLYSLNAGIIGGNDYAFFSDFFDRATKFLNDNKQYLLNTEIGLLNVIFEQYYLYRLIITKKKKISYLWNKVSPDFSECLQFHMVPHGAHYVHPIGGIKRNMIACQQVETLLRFEFPEAYVRIDSFVKSQADFASDSSAVSEEFQVRQLANVRQWRAARSAYSLKLQLSATTKLSPVKLGAGGEECNCVYFCPYEKRDRAITLYGTDTYIRYFEQPASINDLLQQFPDSKGMGRKAYMKSLLDTFSAHIFYYGTLNIVQ